MRKKITLTSYRNTPIDFSVDEIESIDIVDDVTFITTKGNVAYFVKESKSRVLRMIETAKQGGLSRRFYDYTIKESSFNNELELSLFYDDIEDIYILYIDAVYHGEFVFTLLEQEFSSKCDAEKCYNEKHKQIEMLYTKC